MGVEGEFGELNSGYSGVFKAIRLGPFTFHDVLLRTTSPQVVQSTFEGPYRRELRTR